MSRIWIKWFYNIYPLRRLNIFWKTIINLENLSVIYSCVSKTAKPGNNKQEIYPQLTCLEAILPIQILITQKLRTVKFKLVTPYPLQDVVFWFLPCPIYCHPGAYRTPELQPWALPGCIYRPRDGLYREGVSI